MFTWIRTNSLLVNFTPCIEGLEISTNKYQNLDYSPLIFMGEIICKLLNGYWYGNSIS